MIRNQSLHFEYYLWMSPEEKEFILSRDYGIEINDFCTNESYYDGVDTSHLVAEYKRTCGNKTNKSFHGPFMYLNIGASDRDLADIARRRISRAMEIADDIGCNQVVFHTGYTPIKNIDLSDKLVDIHTEFWSGLARRFPHMQINIENVFEPDPVFFCKLFSALNSLNCPSVRMCFDIAHCMVFGNQQFHHWIDTLAGHIRHIHLSNNNLLADNHNSLDDGLIHLANCMHYIEQKIANPTWAFEVSGYANSIKSLDYLRTNGLVEQ